MILVIGGSGSGKSEYAEELLCNMAAERGLGLCYIATMEIQSAEDEKKAVRHRALRDGKGFATVERPRDISLAANELPHDVSGESPDIKKTAALLECVSTLMANEMFAGNVPVPAGQVAEKVTGDILSLDKSFPLMVAVTDDIFAGPVPEEGGVKEYAAALAEINRSLAKVADEVYEVVCGLGIRIK